SRLLKRGFWWHGTEDVPFLRIKGFQWREHAGSPKPLFGIIDHIIRPNKAWVCSLVRHSGGLLIRRSRVQIPSGPLLSVIVPDQIHPYVLSRPAAHRIKTASRSSRLRAGERKSRVTGSSPSAPTARTPPCGSPGSLQRWS